MKYFVVFFVMLLIIPAYAETQTSPTDKGVLDVKLTYESIEPNTEARIMVDFINPQTQKIQEHIDYTVKVLKEGQGVFGPTQLIHTSLGTVNIPIEFKLGDGIYTMSFEVEGILFQPIPKETATFDIPVGKAYADAGTKDKENGGCLVATATFGSEMAPQVQQLRELRDNTILGTSSGAAFMEAFNRVYYSFSPAIADLQRESPIFNHIVRISIIPMLASLSILGGIQIDSEAQMLGYGMSVILLNMGMYLGIPIGMVKLYQFRRSSR